METMTDLKAAVSEVYQKAQQTSEVSNVSVPSSLNFAVEVSPTNSDDEFTLKLSLSDKTPFNIVHELEDAFGVNWFTRLHDAPTPIKAD